MKVLKYVVIIVALAVVFLSVYIATGKSEYEISVQQKTELSKQRLFRYVDNLQNFADWNAWNKQVESFKTDSNFKGKNARVTWSGNEAFIANSSPNDTVFLNLDIDGSEYMTKMFFKEENGNATIHWKVNGSLSFSEKFRIFFQGTPQSLIAPMFQESLINIANNISENLKNFSIKNEGVVSIPETIYIKQVVESNIESLGDKMFQSMEHMNNFAKNFELEPYGSPFTIFENIDVLSGNVKYSVCMPIKNLFHTAEGSDIVCETKPAFYGYKTVLKGDYIHSDKAWEEVKKQITTNNLTQRADLKPLSIYKTSILTTQRSNEWITEFIIPINEAFIPIVDEPRDKTAR